METDVAALTLAKIAEGLDKEEQEEYDNQEQNDNEAYDQPLDAWMEIQDGLTEKEREDINLHIQPVHLMLTKVHNNIISSHMSLTWALIQALQAWLHTEKFYDHSPPTVV